MAMKKKKLLDQAPVKAESLPNCPQCGSNEFVEKAENQHTMTQLFIIKPLDRFICTKCIFGF
jgi:hypothetical protein